MLGSCHRSFEYFVKQPSKPKDMQMTLATNPLHRLSRHIDFYQTSRLKSSEQRVGREAAEMHQSVKCAQLVP